jgi:hypothetical protein
VAVQAEQKGHALGTVVVILDDQDAEAVGVHLLDSRR